MTEDRKKISELERARALDLQQTTKEMEILKKQISEMDDKIFFASLDQTVTFVNGLYVSEKTSLSTKDFEKKYGFKPEQKLESNSDKHILEFLDAYLKRPNLDKETKTRIEEAKEFWGRDNYIEK